MADTYSERLIRTCTRATVAIPYHLRSITDEQKSITLLIDDIKPTVRQVLSILLANYPALASSILDDNGEIGRFLSVYVNDKNIRQLNYLDTELFDNSNELSIRAALAGG